MEKEIIDSVPKSLKQKARRVLDKIKGTVSWNDIGEMVYIHTPEPRSNIIDLVNDALRNKEVVSTGGLEHVRSRCELRKPTYGFSQ